MTIVKIPAPANLEAENVAVAAVDPGAARDAAEALVLAFSWCESAEGAEFWIAVYDRVQQIAEDGKLK